MRAYIKGGAAREQLLNNGLEVLAGGKVERGVAGAPAGINILVIHHVNDVQDVVARAVVVDRKVERGHVGRVAAKVGNVLLARQKAVRNVLGIVAREKLGLLIHIRLKLRRGTVVRQKMNERLQKEKKIQLERSVVRKRRGGLVGAVVRTEKEASMVHQGRGQAVVHYKPETLFFEFLS